MKQKNEEQGKEKPKSPNRFYQLFSFGGQKLIPFTWGLQSKLRSWYYYLLSTHSQWSFADFGNVAEDSNLLIVPNWVPQHLTSELKSLLAEMSHDTIIVSIYDGTERAFFSEASSMADVSKILEISLSFEFKDWDNRNWNKFETQLRELGNAARNRAN